MKLELGELWRYRELLYFLTLRDVKIRYKQTVLGLLWAFVQPFVKMVVFSLVFGGLAKMETGGYPYPIFLYAGLLPWQYFSEALSRASQSLVGSSTIITKVYFPRLIVPLASVGGCLMDFLISFVILLGLMLYYPVPPTWRLLLVIPLSLTTTIAGLGVGTLVSALNVTYRDFRYMMPFIIQTWMFLTPVVYPPKLIPSQYRWLLWLDPMTGPVEGFRSAVLGQPLDWTVQGVSLASGLVLLVLGLLYFRRVERKFADII